MLGKQRSRSQLEGGRNEGVRDNWVRPSPSKGKERLPQAWWVGCWGLTQAGPAAQGVVLSWKAGAGNPRTDCGASAGKSDGFKGGFPECLPPVLSRRS